ncbi:MAG: PEPxxWA-CTERM sorting domain-containing protein [Sphingomicrobium sp.]
MAVSALSRRWAWGRRSGAFAGLLGIAAAISFAGYSNQHVAAALADTVTQGVKTVASLLAERSPGHRPKGKLASLKHKRHPVLHARALPKVRHLVPAVPPIVEAPPITPPNIGAVPVYAVPAGFPELPIIVGPPTPYGPPILSNIPPPGGGGGFVPPPIVTQQVPPPPPPPPPPAVPEPASWAMMLVGFAAIGGMLRREKWIKARASGG